MTKGSIFGPFPGSGMPSSSKPRKPNFFRRFGGTLLSAAGSTIGGFLGGPAGAKIGGQVGRVASGLAGAGGPAVDTGFLFSEPVQEAPDYSPVPAPRVTASAPVRSPRPALRVLNRRRMSAFERQVRAWRAGRPW